MQPVVEQRRYGRPVRASQVGEHLICGLHRERSIPRTWRSPHRCPRSRSTSCQALGGRRHLPCFSQLRLALCFNRTPRCVRYRGPHVKRDEQASQATKRTLLHPRPAGSRQMLDESHRERVGSRDVEEKAVRRPSLLRIFFAWHVLAISATLLGFRAFRSSRS